MISIAGGKDRYGHDRLYALDEQGRLYEMHQAPDHLPQHGNTLVMWWQLVALVDGPPAWLVKQRAESEAK